MCAICTIKIWKGINLVFKSAHVRIYGRHPLALLQVEVCLDYLNTYIYGVKQEDAKRQWRSTFNSWRSKLKTGASKWRCKFFDVLIDNRNSLLIKSYFY